MHKTRLPAWVVLTLISLVAALLLGVTYEMTKDAIATQELEKAAATRRALVPEAVEFVQLECDESLTALYAGNNADGEAVGYVATLSVTGFGGPVEIVVGMDAKGVLSGISVGGSDFSETPGLGAKAKEPAFTDQFTGLSAPIALGDGVDAITSATITSNAVVRGVNSACEAVGKVAGFATAAPANVGQTADGRYYSEVSGFGGPVYVEIGLDDAGAISDIVIGNENFNETPGYGKKAQEPAFYEQFLGLFGTLTLGTDVDAISGATVTSTAVVKAVNQALAFSRGETVESEPVDATVSATSSATGASEAVESEAGLCENGNYYGLVQGFHSPVYVEVTLDDNYAITALTIGNDQFNETQGIGTRALEPAFAESFIGLTEVKLNENVDALAGATVTSKAVADAVNMAIAYAKGEEYTVDTTTSATGADASSSATGTADTTTSATGATDTTTSATGTTEETPVDAPAAGQLENGNYFAYGSGFAGPVYVEVTLDENGAITAVKIGDDQFNETQGFGSKALEPAFVESFIGHTEVKLGENVDAIAGATVTSTAVANAINDAIAFSKGEAPAADAATSATGEADTATSATGADTSSAATGETDTTTSATGTTDTTTSATGTTEEAPADVPAAGQLENGNYFAYGNGFVGPVYVEVTLDENGAITAVKIGDDQFNETQGFGSKALEPAFAESFIGLTEVNLGENVDAIAGATVTSNAVANAINDAISFIKGEAPAVDAATSATGADASSSATGTADTTTSATGTDTTTSATGTTEETPTDAPAAGQLENGNYFAYGNGFVGPVYVEVTLDENGAITTVKIGDDQFNETQGFGSKALEPAFAESFIGLTEVKLGENVDAIAGATVTSTAVANAINDAIAFSKGE
ncbi:MAG: FMN-binding protein, partial [Clostridiales bacterium]|nr:FMN-binding protein [Clostridiales bacterium]